MNGKRWPNAAMWHRRPRLCSGPKARRPAKSLMATSAMIAGILSNHSCPKQVAGIAPGAAGLAKSHSVALASSLRLRPRFQALSKVQTPRRTRWKPVPQQTMVSPFRIATLLLHRVEACATAAVLMPSAKVKTGNRDFFWTAMLSNVADAKERAYPSDVHFTNPPERANRRIRPCIMVTHPNRECESPRPPGRRGTRRSGKARKWDRGASAAAGSSRRRCQAPGSRTASKVKRPSAASYV